MQSIAGLELLLDRVSIRVSLTVLRRLSQWRRQQLNWLNSLDPVYFAFLVTDLPLPSILCLWLRPLKKLTSAVLVSYLFYLVSHGDKRFACCY